MYLKKHYDCKFIVFVDDILILTKTNQEQTLLYKEVLAQFSMLGLHLNFTKVSAGRFANSAVSYCGYKFAGGCVGIDPIKIEAFKESIAALIVTAPKLFSERAYIKRLNQKLNGFGHYYKYGNIVGTYAQLDAFVRGSIRSAYKRWGLAYPNNNHLSGLGLVSLEALAKGKKQHLIAAQAYKKQQSAKRESTMQEGKQNDLVLGYLEELINQNKQLIALNKGILYELKQLNHIDL